jgi:HAD superfamily hydrolase (TIGR01509 family)
VTVAFEAILFDFDGVLIESEYVGNLKIAQYLTGIGHPTSAEESVAQFMGLSGKAFIEAVEGWIGRRLPSEFNRVMSNESARVLEEGLDPVAGAIDFVENLPPGLPRAIVSSSSTDWIARHLDHIGLGAHFGEMIFSGREHVARGKPSPDLYLHAAAALGADIRRILIVEDSPVGVTGAVASGATVIGLCAGSHCGPDHGARLKTLGAHGIAASFTEVAAALKAGARS